MFDAKSLLDQFLGGGQGGPFGQQDQRGQGRNQGRNQGGAGDLIQQAGQALSGFGGGALTGGLAGLLLGSKGGRKLAGSALTYGGLAVAGALAYRAYQNYQAGKDPNVTAAPANRGSVPLLPPPPDTPFNPTSEADQQTLGRHLLRAMISAAKADGHIDATEQANIFAQMDRLNVSAEDKVFVMDELRKPLDVDSVASAARSPEEAAEIYTVSLLAIDVDNPAERGYLALLAARLKLDDKLVAHLHASVDGATEKVAQPVAVTR
jgi:uncharacterized membrane protein YebE (DUF533 family)